MLNLKFGALDEEIVKANKVLYCQELSSSAIEELQTVLKKSNYYHGRIDGIYGINTLNALKNYKTDSYFSHPTQIGPGTVRALKRLAEVATVTEQPPLQKPQLNPLTGSSKGASIRLPGGAIAYEHELIVPGIPLTWGEMTKGLTRKPENEQIVRNIIYVAEKFGKIRSAFGAPIKITSGYRPPHLKIGSKYSQHKVGLAIDICPMDRADLYKLWNVCVKSDAVGLGRGIHRGFCHADWRQNGQRRVVFGY